MKSNKKSLVVILSLIFWTCQAFSQAGKKPVGDLLYKIINSQGVDSAVAKYHSLKKMGTDSYDFGEQQLNTLGYRLLQENKNEAALAIFHLNAESYPKSINVWDSYAEAYMKDGNYPMAKKYYQKELEKLAPLDMPANQKSFLKTRTEFQLFVLNHFDPPSEATLNVLSIFGGPGGRWDMNTIARFKQQHNNIPLSLNWINLYYSPVPSGIEQQFDAGYPVEVATSYIGGDYRRYILAGKIADISDLWKKEGWDKIFHAPFKRMASLDGKQYFVPMAYQWNPVFYRKDIFRLNHLTPPKTWQDLLDLCDTLNELGYIPFSIAVKKWPPPVARWFSILDLRLNGAEFHNKVEAGMVPFTDERIRNVFEHWRELFRHHAFADSSYNNNYNVGVSDLTSGKAVMYNLGEWLFESLNEEQGSKLNFYPFPVLDASVPKAEIVHTYGAYMTTNNRHVEASKELLKFLANTETQTDNAATLHRIVANNQVSDTVFSPMQRRIKQYINNVPDFVPLFEFSTRPAFARKALAIFQHYWKNPEDINSAIEKLEEARLSVFKQHSSPQAFWPEVSPDGRRVLFLSPSRGGPIYLMNADGSDSHQIAEGTRPSWFPDGKRIVAVARSETVEHLVVMKADGSEPDTLPTAYPRYVWRPRVSPDGKTIIVGDYWPTNAPNIFHLVKTDGTPLQDIHPNVPGELVEATWSHDGRLAFVAFSRDTVKGWPVSTKLYVMDGDGSNERAVVTLSNAAQWISWSPDDREVALQDEGKEGDGNILIVDITTGVVHRITHHDHPYLDETPSWSSDGWIYFQSNRTGRYTIYRMHADGSDQEQLTY